jgi:hypothetical protein
MDAGRIGPSRPYEQPSTKTSLLVVVLWANPSQFLRVRVGEKLFRVLSGAEFQDDHPLRRPVAFDWLRFGASHDVSSAMLLDEGRRVRDVRPETFEVMNGKIEHEVGFHSRTSQFSVDARTMA